jgi:hypothetical protein
VTTDITPVVAIGDVIYLELDNGAILTSGAVTAVSYGAPDTSITLAIPYVAGTTGWINLLTKRPGYYVEVEILYESSGEIAFSAMRYSGTVRGDVQMDVAGIVNEYLTGDVSPYLNYGYALIGFPLKENNHAAWDGGDACRGFFINYREVWVGSSNFQLSDAGNIFYAVKAARQVTIYGDNVAGDSSYVTGAYGGYMKEYQETTGRKFLTRFKRPRFWKNRSLHLSWLDPICGASDRTYFTVTIYYANGNVWGTLYHIPGGTSPVYKELYSTNGNPIFSTQAINYDKEYPTGLSGDISWTGLGGDTYGPTVTLAPGNYSKYLLIPCLLKSGITYTVQFTFSVIAGAGAETVRLRAQACSLNLSSVNATSTSANYGQNTTQTITFTLTPSADCAWIVIDGLHNGGVNNRVIQVNYYYMDSPDYNVLTGMAPYITAALINRNHSALTETTGISEVLTIPIESTNDDPKDNLVQLVWKNSLGGDSSWCFDHSQPYNFRYSDGMKRKRMTLFTRGLSIADWEALNELNSTGESYKVAINEFLSTSDRTHRRRGIDVVMIDTSGRRTGVTVIPTEITTKSDRVQHNFEVTIELPEIFEVQ